MVNVVVGIIFNDDREVFINERRAGTFMSGYWEFPGGKINEGESPQVALIRELQEELSISVTKCSHQFDFTYSYPSKSVILKVFVIHLFEGEIIANEGQKICFTPIDTLKQYLLLPTVMPIINRIWLSKCYHIRNYHPQLYTELEGEISKFELLQLRSKTPVSIDEVASIYTLCKQHKITFILNIPNVKHYLSYCDGIHLTSILLMNTHITTTKLLSASTHSKAEILRANELKADIITISPIKSTPTHPHTTPLGYKSAAKLATVSNGVVYFLGGMTINELGTAREYGAYGIAGITKL